MTSPTPTIEVEESGWQRWTLRLLPALTFLVGLALGAAVMVASRPDQVIPEASDEPSAPVSAPDGQPADTVVTVPGACKDAAAALTEATRLLDDAAAAVRDFRPDELVGLLNRLEDLDGEVRSQTAQCARIDVSEGVSPAP